jgi:dienelactone hydrolase
VILHRLAAVVLLAAGVMSAALPTRAEPQTVDLVLAGRSVPVDVYRPAEGVAVRGAVVLSHGFTRSRTTMGGHAAALAEAGVVAVTPDLPFTFDFHGNGRGLSELVARLRAGSAQAPAVERVVLVGFSAGGLSSLLAATTPGVVGYIGLDPFDRTLPDDGGAIGRAAAPRMTTEALLLRAPPSRCNADAVAAPWAQLLPKLVSDRVIDGASHCDFESPTDWMCRLACGAPDPARQRLVRDTLMDAVRRWLP